MLQSFDGHKMSQFSNAIALILTVSSSLWVYGQESISGRVLTNDGQDTKAVYEAKIQWLHDTLYAISDSDGFFELSYNPNSTQIIISHPEFISDTLHVKSGDKIFHFLLPHQNLEEVQLVQSKKSMMQSYVEIGNIVNVTSDELLKAACCTLAESFETNPSIDSYFADAITGVRQIRMLGLNSNQILLSNENIPMTRTIGQTFEYSFIPGPQIESIHISKGTGSVVGTYQSLGGEINVELKKPITDSRLVIDLFQSLHGRFEANLGKTLKLNNRLSTSIYGHYNQRNKSLDHNEDGFLDNPLVDQINLLNRWQYIDNKKGFVVLGSFRYVNDQKNAGQKGLNFDFKQPEEPFWQSQINTIRFDGSLKMGYVNPEIPYRSTGLQLSYIFNDQNSIYHQRTLDLWHKNFYANFIYSSILFNTKTTFKTGLIFGLDTVNQDITNVQRFGNRNTPHLGSYFEVTHNNLNGLSVMAGLRTDIYSDFGIFVTPRLNVRHQLFEKTQLRLSIGSGRRASYYVVENQQLLASNRKVIIDSVNDFGKNIVWNIGGSLTQRFDLFGNDSQLILDYYTTNYQTQTIIDWETPGEVSFYETMGKSKANSFQVEYNYLPSHELDLRMAYRYDDIKTTYRDGYRAVPLIPKHRFFFNFSWVSIPTSIGALWRTNFTIQHVGPQRLVKKNMEASEIYSEPYQLINAQINRKFNQQLELYVGSENLGSFTQKDPIVSANNPSDPTFDASQIYGPIFGLMAYIGLKWRI
ncbi:MAG: TonB-dependent receptor plug domain-containing protein [Flavobacteriaceae bacterium]|nr:TonB-dependent receptor plug domain-containing protein [Flavobacteriaceae bacterium]MCY4253580.1 TonB-dependent receptor plug domain-containing protein [Flavobacteriaceae bacterium]